MIQQNEKRVELQLEDSNSFSFKEEEENKELTTFVDFDLKMEENEKKISMYVEVDANMVNNLIKELAKLPNGFDDLRKFYHKRCIHVKTFQTPFSKVNGNFYLTYLNYKGLSINVNFDFENEDQIAYSRVKAHYYEDQKWRVKWLDSEQEEKKYIFTILTPDLGTIMKEKLLIQMNFDKKRIRQTSFIGIENQGNTCYMNSILQVLFYIIPIRKIILEKQLHKNKFIKSLQELFVDLMTLKSSANASEILKNFGAFCQYPYRQQDVHEFLINFIDKLQHQFPELKYLWSGKDHWTIKSRDNRYESKQQQDFNELQLHMTDTQSKNFTNIKQSLASLLKEQNVEQMIETDKYGKLPVVKVRFFQSLPPLIFMNVKRYEYNATRRQLSKICLDLDYPPMINLDFLLNTPNGKLEYILYAITVHKGRTPNSGHYFSFINVSKNEKQPDWYEFNDSCVSKVEQKRIYEYTGKKKSEMYLNEKYRKWCKKSVYSQETSYLLVYMRRQNFNEFQNSQINLPQWYYDRQKRKLTEEEEKTKCVIKFCSVPLEQEDEFDPFSHELNIDEVKVKKKNQRIQKQLQQYESFIGFKVGTVWRVNRATRKIVYTGKKFNNKYTISTDVMNKTRHGVKNNEYFLVFSKEKYEDTEGNLGILEIQEYSKKTIKRYLHIKERDEIDKMINELTEKGKKVDYLEREMDEYKLGWNDYIYIKVS